MGISLRHHVLSLVAAFLMLLVGLLVGVGLTSKPELMETVQEYNQLFIEQVRTMERIAETQESFADEALPRLVEGKLTGQYIVVVVTARPDDNPFTPEVIGALETAGADVPYHVVCRDDFVRLAPEIATDTGDGASAAATAAERLASHIAQGDRAALDTFRRRGLIRLRGEVPRRTPSGVVVLGGAKEGFSPDLDALDRPLIETLCSEELGPVVGCEGDSPVSYMPTYKGLDISTVDNVHLARGQFSLVMALAGRAGHYGDQESAAEKFAPVQ